MLVQITNAGIAALNANLGVPLPMSRGDLGDGYNYIPSQTQAALQGAVVYSQPSLGPQPVTANVVRYSLFLDANTGDFDFGEVGLYLQDGVTLFATGVSNELISKIQVAATLGNTISIDLYLSSNDFNYAMWLEVSDSSGTLNVPRTGSVDLLPPPHDAIPNIYVVQPATADQTAFLAYTDQAGLWAFDAYALSTTNNNQYVIGSSTNNSITIPNAQADENLVPAFLGDKVLQFTSGSTYGICRNIQTVIQGPTDTTITFAAMAIVPQSGNTFFVYSRDPKTVQNIVLPIATTTSLGVVSVGAGLNVTTADPLNNVTGGELSVNRVTIPDGIVWSIGTKQGTQLQGDVPALNANQLIGSVLTVNNQGPDANGNIVVSTIPQPGDLPIATATTLGVVRGDPANNITIAPNGALGLGFTPVKTVNNGTPDGAGNVSVVGLVSPVAITTGQNFNSFTTAGLYFVASDAIAVTLVNPPLTSILSGSLEVISLSVSGTGDVFQRWTQHGAVYERRLTGSTWSAWANMTPGQGGSMRVIGNWNALTNSATVGADTHVLMAGGVVAINGTPQSANGFVYRVSVGNNAYSVSPLTLDGITTWVAGDQMIGTGSSWSRSLGNTIVVS